MKRVHFIGNGGESVKILLVDAETPLQAIELAEQAYEDNGYTFEYCYIEVEPYEYLEDLEEV